MAKRNQRPYARDSRFGVERNRQLRTAIAQAAAKLIVEHGIDDWAHAKRKAARQLGASEQGNLPDAEEIEQALREYNKLYRPQSQIELLLERRTLALHWMKQLAGFSPRLTAGVASGLATSHSEVRLELVADDSKAVELFMLARGIAFASARNSRGAIDPPEYVIDAEDATLRLTVITPSRRRNLGRERQEEQLDMDSLQSLLAASASGH